MKDVKPQKKRYEITKTAFFTETVYAENKEKAVEQFNNLEMKFADPGDYHEGFIDQVEEKCPRCGKYVEQFEHEDPHKNCPHCNLPFKQVESQ